MRAAVLYLKWLSSSVELPEPAIMDRAYPRKEVKATR